MRNFLFLTNKETMALEKILIVSWVSEWRIYVFTLAPFDSNLSFISLFTCVDPDPIWIRIHNTKCNKLKIPELHLSGWFSGGWPDVRALQRPDGREFSQPAHSRTDSSLVHRPHPSPGHRYIQNTRAASWETLQVSVTEHGGDWL